MTSGQRKAHKYIWLILVVLVPVLMLLSVKNLNLTTSYKEQKIMLKETKKTVLNSAENDLIKANLYKNRIEIILKLPLKNSSAVIYAVDKSGEKSDLIGQLTTLGIYNFDIENLPKGILIYDSLKDKEITKLTL